MEQIRSVTWEAPEHTHPDKGGDWYFALGIVTVSVVVASVIFSNFLFAILSALSGASIAIAASQPPRIVRYGVSARGIQVDTTLHPIAMLRSYYLNDDDPRGPVLLVLSQKTFAPMLVIPVPEEYLDEIEVLLNERLPEEFLEEPLLSRLLEKVGL
jgi:hypothetical protein